MATITENLAALMYYEENGIKTQFEELTEEEREKWQLKATKVLMLIDKINMMVVRKVTPEEREAKDRKNVETLTDVIREFVKGLKTTKPDLFPAEELARRIFQ